MHAHTPMPITWGGEGPVELAVVGVVASLWALGRQFSWQKLGASRAVNKLVMSNGDVGGPLRRECGGQERGLGIERALELAGTRALGWPRLSGTEGELKG